MEASAQLKHVEVSLIEVSGANPRKDLKGETFKDLKQSIAEHGILVPLLVRPKGKGYELVAGERRLTAARELNLKTVPVAIRDLDDHMARILMLLENLQREDLEPLEEAAAIEELLKDTGDGGMTQEELAKKLSKSQPWIANRLRLNKAPAEVKKLLTDGKITPQHVMEILPYSEYAIFGEVIMPMLKKETKDGGITVGRLKQNLEYELTDDYGEHVLNLTDFPYSLHESKAFFDFTGCDQCGHVVIVDQGGGKERVCLNRPCYADRLNIAKQKREEAIKKEHQETKERLEKKLGKKVKSIYVDTSKLHYDEYTNFPYTKDFDTTDCEGCEFCKRVKARNARIVDDDGDLEEDKVCLKPGCMRGKKAQKSRVQNKVCRAAIEASDLSLKEYLAGRQKGFTDEELKFICNRVTELVPHSYGRGDDAREAKVSAKDGAAAQENAVIRLLVREQLGPIRYGLDLETLKRVQKGWPFKVSKEKTPEAPKTKKVQEKRKKRVT